MSKFDLNDAKDSLIVQARLDWIFSPARVDEPIWVWRSAVQVFEEDCGLPKGFINVLNFPDFLPGNYKLTVQDLRNQL